MPIFQVDIDTTKDILLQENVFEEFNTLSIIYGQPSDHFISQTIPYIKGQPYTEEDGKISYACISYSYDIVKQETWLKWFLP